MSEPRHENSFVEFAAGALILDGRSAADALYLIERGVVLLERGNGLTELHAGDVFGETALLQPPQPQRAAARSDVRLLRIEIALLPDVLRHQPTLALPLLRQLARRAQPDDGRTRDVGPRDGDTPLGLPVVDAAVVSTAAPPASPEPAGPFVLRHTEGHIVLPQQRGECLVGRPDPATGAVPEVNLGPLDLARSLSRRHARLLLDGDGGIAVREEPGVSNGTWINGVRLGAGQTAALNRGDKLRFGAIEVELVRE